MPARMSKKSLIAAVVIAVVFRLGFQYYREHRAENRRLQQHQDAQLELERFQAQQQAAERIQDKEQAKAELQSNPSTFLIGGTSVNVFRRSLFTSAASSCV